MSNNKLAIIVGSGPGIGVATGIKFAAEGFSVALLSRNGIRLQEDAAKVRKTAMGDAKVQTFAVDAGDHIALQNTLREIHRTMGSPEVILYNAAWVEPSIIGQTEPEYIAEGFKVTNVGLYVTATWALPLMTELAKVPGNKPSFLLTSTGIEQLPGSAFFALFMQKASQRNFLDALSTVAGPAGVHTARSEINGIVADEEPELNAKNIAEGLYTLSRQDKSEWQSKISLGSVEELVRKMTGGQ